MNSLEFAIKMELDGQEYYLKCAEKNKDNRLHNLFLSLAADEENHGKIIKNKLDEISYKLEENASLKDFDNVFKTTAEFTSEIKALPDQMDMYRAALEKEKQSIDLYQKLMAEATDDNEKSLYDFLIKQETHHFSILEDLILMIKKSEDWVENAEFGVREEY